jgi:hypothetical protein
MKHEAIYNLYPLVKHIVEAEDGIYTAYDANNNIVSINMSDVNVKAEELKDEYNSKQYQRDRAKAYPSIQEQLDLQYWDKVNGTDNWEQVINAVKAQHPKA